MSYQLKCFWQREVCFWELKFNYQLGPVSHKPITEYNKKSWLKGKRFNTHNDLEVIYSTVSDLLKLKLSGDLAGTLRRD